MIGHSTIIGDQPGPTIAIFAGIHGNEKAGVHALHALLPDLTITKGTLHLVFANPPAIEANVRAVTKNLNRCFTKGNIGTTYEDARARELMQLLDTCDALLDLHMFNDEEGEPFIICEENALDIVSGLNAGIVSTNWTTIEPGATDGYMFEQGKIGICFECGPVSKAQEYTAVATEAIYKFLSYYGMVIFKAQGEPAKQKIIRAERAIYSSGPGFTLAPGISSFSSLDEGQLIAVDNGKELTAKHGEYVIFPRYGATAGEEACIIGTIQ